MFIIVCLLLMFVPVYAASIVSAEKEDSKENKQATVKNVLSTVEKVNKKDNDVYINFSGGEGMKVSFLKENLFRLHLDPKKEFQEYPTPNSKDYTTTIIDKEVIEFEKSMAT